MKIGLIADIHADLKALKVALDILQGQQVEQVVCCGDLVDKGPDGDAVVQMIRERAVPSVMGNHDYLAPADQRWLRENYASTYPMLLTEETLAYLNQLPATLAFSWEGKSVLVAHGTPTSWDEYLFSYSPRLLFEQVFTSSEAEVVILGHTHEPMMALVNDRWIFNPGSVCGIRAEGSATCATLSLPAMTYRVFDVRTGRRVQPAYVHYEAT
jgi:putative phosphoesterase